MWDPYDPISYFAHIAIGFLAYGAGVVALSTVKGSSRHILAGRVYVAAMIIPVATTIVFMFTRFLPLILVMTVAVIYLIASGVLAFRSTEPYARPLHAVLLVLPLALSLFAGLALARSLRGGAVALLPGQFLIFAIFAGLAVGDARVLRRWPADSNAWTRRHLWRMVFSFAFATMAILRIGIDAGIPFEMSVWLPLVLALLAGAYFDRRLESVD